MGITVLVVVALIAVAGGGIYLLLKSMGEGGVEAAAPGSCRSGRCGVPTNPQAAGRGALPETQQIPVDEITRKDAQSPNQTL